MSAKRLIGGRLASTAILLLTVSAAVAQTQASRSTLNNTAGPVSLSEPGNSARDREVVVSLVPEAAATADVTLETALVDIENDRNAEVVAKIKSKATCDADGKRCRMIVARYSGNAWKIAFDRRATAVAMAAPGFGGMRAIIADGRETWTWNGAIYALDVTASGEPVSFKEAPSANRDLLVAQFGASASRLAAKMPVKVMVGTADLTGKGNNLVVARLEGAGYCGVVFGCPTRVLQVKDGKYLTLLDGVTHGKVSIMSVNRDGWRDVIAEMPKSGSRVVYGWSGKNYGVAERFGMGGSR